MNFQDLDLMNPVWFKYLPTFLRSRLEGRTYLQNVISNTGWQFADKIVRMGVNLLVGIWLARYLGPEQFGIFSYALALVALVAPLASLGLEDFVVRNIVRDPECRDETLGTSFILCLAGGLVSIVVAIGAILFLRPDDVLSHWLVGIIAVGVLFQSFYVIEYWFNSQVQAKFIILARNPVFLCCALLKILLIVSEQPLIAFAWVALVEVAIGAIGLLITYSTRNMRVRDWRFRLGTAKSLLSDSWPHILTGLVFVVYLRIDQVMLGELSGSSEVGVYSVAVRLAEVWLFIPMAIFWSVFPAIIEARATSENLMFERLQKFYNLMAFLAYAVALPVTFLADWLVGTLFGEAYLRAGMMLILLTWANVFSSLDIARNSFLTSMNWTRLYFLTVLLGATLNISLNYLLIPRFGGNGAAFASLLAYWFASHGSCFLFRPLYKTGMMMSKALVFPKIW